jgi:DNA repair photolyase
VQSQALFVSPIGQRRKPKREGIIMSISTTSSQGSLFDALPVVVNPDAVVLNPDGSVKGCTTIYAPGTQAGEYAELACNPYTGCGHCCRYNPVGRYRSCYVPLSTHQPVPAFNAGAILKPDFIAKLRKDAAKYRAARTTAQVLLSFTSDPYHPGDTSPTREVLKILIEAGLAVCTLTKGGTRAARDLDLFRGDRDAYAATLTSLDDRFSQRWEPKAPLPGDRIAALKAFHEAGIFTWVSLEPVLDVEATLAVIAQTHRFVDLYKVGRVNYSKLTQTIDWRDFTLRVIDLLNRLGAKHYIKKDLQPFLPPGYPNPLRVPQHHDGGGRQP